LRLFHDQGATLQHATRQLLDRRLGAVICHGLDESKASRTNGLAVQRDPHAANLDAFVRERFLELLLVDVIREVADEKAGTH